MTTFFAWYLTSADINTTLTVLRETLKLWEMKQACASNRFSAELVATV